MNSFETPDFQRGQISPQGLLAAVPSNTASQTVTLLPGTQTLVVILESSFLSVRPSCIGVTTGLPYFGVMLPHPGDGQGVAWYFDATDTIDTQVTVTFPTAPIAQWFIYCDASTGIVADAATLRNLMGSPYVIPTVPSINHSDHPPNELLVTSGLPAATGTFIAAPGLGSRLRLFGSVLSTVTAGLLGAINDHSSGKVLNACAGSGNSPMLLPGQGVPLVANAALDYTIQAGAGTMAVIVYYTVEVV